LDGFSKNCNRRLASELLNAGRTARRQRVFGLSRSQTTTP
jgi:hypothetical protein